MMPSIGAMIKQIAGLADTQDVNDRTSEFINDMVECTGNGARTSQLTEAQVTWIEDIFKRHFG